MADELARETLLKFIKRNLKKEEELAANDGQYSLFGDFDFKRLPKIIRIGDRWTFMTQATRAELLMHRRDFKRRRESSTERFEGKRELEKEYERELNRIIRNMAPFAKEDPGVTVKEALEARNAIKEREARTR